MKKVFSLLMVAVMVLSCVALVGCGNENAGTASDMDVKVGFIFLHMQVQHQTWMLRLDLFSFTMKTQPTTKTLWMQQML